MGGKQGNGVVVAVIEGQSSGYGCLMYIPVVTA